jgi:hypothetical protein
VERLLLSTMPITTTDDALEQLACYAAVVLEAGSR